MEAPSVGNTAGKAIPGAGSIKLDNAAPWPSKGKVPDEGWRNVARRSANL